jgi:hypothetical protein
MFSWKVFVALLSFAAFGKADDVAEGEAVPVDFDKKFWVCGAGDAKFLGEYITEEGNDREGAQVWTNKHDMSIFRNSGVWYMGKGCQYFVCIYITMLIDLVSIFFVCSLGNLETWPPETHYRCDNMDGCLYAEPLPAVPGVFSVNPRYGKDPAPALSDTACGQSNDEL